MRAMAAVWLQDTDFGNPGDLETNSSVSFEGVMAAPPIHPELVEPARSGAAPVVYLQMPSDAPPPPVPHL